MYPNCESLISSYTGWGFRSNAIQREFESIITKPHNSFVCYSGIPSRFINSQLDRKYETANRIIYVGELIERKHPYELLLAVHKTYVKLGFSLTFVGDGPERKKLESFIKANNLESKVKLVGKIPREIITKHLDESDIFAMASRGEAFGLVYLEAMARGCITIASRNEGIDGVIKDNVNGYLVEAGNIDEISDVLKRICSFTSNERKAIALAGYETASNMTDKNMALDYLNKLKSL